MNIEFGCGANPTRRGYLTCDIRSLPGVDYVCNAVDIDQHVGADSVDIIYSRHFFEHLTFIQGEELLQVWYKILKPTGHIDMMVPCMDFHIWQWTAKKDYTGAIKGFWGWQREGDTEVWDIHKSGYNYETLSTLVLEQGFINCERIKANRKHLYVRFTK